MDCGLTLILLVAPLQRKAKDSKILISFGNQDFLFSPGMQKNGSLIILGDLNIISQTKGRISRSPGSAKVF